MGSLRDNLYKIAQMNWKNKLNLLLCIASDLQIIHSHKLVHRDLHSGNILQDNLYSAYIADLGLAIQSNIASEMGSEDIYGILPYIAPEIFDKKSYVTASDIYSFGMIMWEILYGKLVYCDREFDNQLQIEICRKNLRPTIIKNTPQCYINLMKECWEKCPEDRPTAEEIYNIFTKWKDDEKILLELSESEQVLKDVLNTHDSTYIESNYRSRSLQIIFSRLSIIRISNLGKRRADKF
ncbi:kinase-like domain-containing protein [Gigaspora rosea]|uniref:Kinase-like domain-containing protein n=1 Tax=Gigaspora rosea TaxID=44941 RepID=A0A397UT13_9GLOM|nr:kinase-like domain-containing protein [Gigaspora rosea]